MDWRELIHFEREFTDPVPHKTRESFKKSGIRLFEGESRFLSHDRLAIGDEELGFEQLVIATGAHPVELHVPGEELLATSDDFLFLEDLPRELLFVGGGLVSFELAHVAVRAGAAVTIVEQAERPLAAFEPKLVDHLVRISREVGLRVLTGVTLTGLEEVEKGRVRVSLSTDDPVEVDLAIHGGGRAPSLSGLDLEAGRIAHGKRGVEVDEFLRSTTNSAVLAAGDCADTSAPPLTPAANAHAHALLQNLLSGEDRVRPDVVGIPSVVFSVPPLAAVGLTEDEARTAQLEFEILEGDMTGWASVKKVSGRGAAYKLIVTPGDEGTFLGAHLLGPGAAETINLFCLAIRHGITARELKAAPLAFPTFAHDVRAMI
jgi:glutathione reductase (NADPH)